MTQSISSLDVQNIIENSNDNKWHSLNKKDMSTIIEHYSSYSYDNIPLVKFTQFYKDSISAIYVKGPLSNFTETFRIVYDDNGEQCETIFSYQGSVHGGHKPSFKRRKTNTNFKPNSFLAIYHQLQSDPNNILLPSKQVSQLQKQHKDKPLGVFISNYPNARVWIQKGSAIPTYRVVSTSRTRNPNVPLAYDITFSFVGNIIKGNDEHIISWLKKESELVSGTAKIITKTVEKLPIKQR